VAQIVLVAVAAASFLAMELMSAWYERRRRADSDRALRD
jgi:hypothetical protein